MYKNKTLVAKQLCYELPCNTDLFSNISFSIKNGQILNVYGDNGSGKSTLLRIISGLIPSSEGEMFWCNELLSSKQQSYHQDMLYIGHQTGLKMGLTAFENLSLDCLISQQNAKISLSEALDRLGLQLVKNVPCEQLSAGQAKRVALARLICLEAALWIIDEPYTHLDKNAIEIVNQLIKRHVQQGGLAIIATHSVANGFENSELTPLLLS